MTTSSDASTDHPETIGAYRIRGVLGEGGMSTVYLADQLEPVRRSVALKMIKLGMDTKQIVKRFEAERQALAVLDHPAIAKVYDAGSSESGRPYFVMERAHGDPITTFCDTETLTINERLELILHVCGAIQHAHQKGLIHRDLKPSNILVGRQDGQIVAKVIDFGIAKAIGVDLAEEVVETRIGQILGTPQYMSPEQAELSARDIDTRTDIYSLGVVLYELLTGVWPLDLESSTVLTIGQMIRETQPVRPSRRIDSGDLDLNWISQTRSTVPSALRKDLHSDLDWITMKALAKERERRYQTVSEFAADIRNYLDRRPVTARPPRRSYLITRFVQRNRLMVGASVAIVAALAFGATVASIGLIRALEAEQLATTEAARAEQRTEQAENLLGFMVGDLRDSLEPLGRLDLMEGVGTEAMKYFSTVNLEALTEGELLRQAQVMTQIGEIRVSEREFDDALAAFSQAYETSNELFRKEPGNGEHLFGRGQAEFWVGYVHWRRGDLSSAREWLSRYLDSSETLSQLDPGRDDWAREVAYGHHNLAVLAFELDDLAAAYEGFIREISLLTELRERGDEQDMRSNIADAESWLGSISLARGELAEAMSFFDRSATQLRALSLEDPQDVIKRTEWAYAIFHITDLAGITGDIGRAEESSLQAKEIFDGLVTQDADNREWARARAQAGIKIAVNKAALSDWNLALAAATASVEELEQLTREEASELPPHEQLIDAYSVIAWIEHERGNITAAAQAKDAALSRIRHVQDSAGMNDDRLGKLASILVLAGQLEAAAGNPQQALQVWREAEGLLQDIMPAARSIQVRDAWVRTMLLQGRRAEADLTREQLNAAGYVPLKPWPAP